MSLRLCFQFFCICPQKWTWLIDSTFNFLRDVRLLASEAASFYIPPKIHNASFCSTPWHTLIITYLFFFNDNHNNGYEKPVWFWLEIWDPACVRWCKWTHKCLTSPTRSAPTSHRVKWKLPLTWPILPLQSQSLPSPTGALACITCFGVT